MKQKVRVWDIPTRLFHWSLVLSIGFMWFSAEQGGDWLAWHLRCGLFILALLVFRVCWGLWGSDTSRFAQFVKPTQIGRYLSGKLSENEQPGHNPVGALMVLALLAALFFQVGTGLFSPDDNTFINSGYLNSLVSDSTGHSLRSLHIQFFDGLLTLIGVHVFTIFFYKIVKKHNLITPMFTGYKYLEGKVAELKFAGIGKFIAAAAVALAVVLVVANIG